MIERVGNIILYFQNPELEHNVVKLFTNVLKEDYLKSDIKSYFEDLDTMTIRNRYSIKRRA